MIAPTEDVRHNMPLSDWSDEDIRVIRLSLECVAAGKVILHDWEFETIMGVNVPTLRQVLSKWPEVDEADPDVRSAVGNSLNNLLGYPHGFHDCWEEGIPVSRQELMRAFGAWRGGRPYSYFDGIV